MQRSAAIQTRSFQPSSSKTRCNRYLLPPKPYRHCLPCRYKFTIAGQTRISKLNQYYIKTSEFGQVVLTSYFQRIKIDHPKVIVLNPVYSVTSSRQNILLFQKIINKPNLIFQIKVVAKIKSSGNKNGLEEVWAQMFCSKVRPTLLQMTKSRSIHLLQTQISTPPI